MIEKILVGVVVGILKYLDTRRDQTRAAHNEVYREIWDLAKRAYEWEVAAAESPDGGSHLRVRDGASPIRLSRDHPDVKERTD